MIHLLNAKGAMDLDRFWEGLFATNGIFDMKCYWEMLASKENTGV